jgi:glycerate-2-kinase
MVIRTFHETSNKLENAEADYAWRQSRLHLKNPEEINQIIRTHSASSQQQGFDNRKAFALVNRITGNSEVYDKIHQDMENNNKVSMHSASEQKEQKKTNLKSFALVNRIGGNNEQFEELQQMIEESAYETKVLEDMASSKREAGQVHQASELKKSNKDQILRFYKLVNYVGNTFGGGSGRGLA